MNKLFNGRYGLDAYSIFLFIFSLMFLQTRFLWVIGLALVGYAFYRILSKDKAQRYLELQKFTTVYQQFLNKVNRVFMGIKTSFRGARTRFSERKQYVFLKCPKCHKYLRLPRNKGKLEVTCPVCHSAFFKKT